MPAAKLGTQNLTVDPSAETLDWSRGVSETHTREWKGERTDVRAKYDTMKNEVGVRELSFAVAEGRARLIAKSVRNMQGNAPDQPTIIEELLGIEIIRALHAAPYFEDMTDDAVAAVLGAVESRLPEADIEGYADTWTSEQKEMRWQMLHGQESYYETAFVLRIRKQGIESAALRGVFTGINTVVAVPQLSRGMKELVGSLPAGEWLYKPPEVGYVQRGIWNVSSEWHWAKKWSVIYGGTLKK